MQRSLTFAIVLLLAPISLISSQAHKNASKGLPGRWVGSMHSGHGDQQVKAVFNQVNAAYSGTMTWMDGSDKQLNHVKLEGNIVTADTEIEIPDGKMKISYILKLNENTLEGIIMGGSGHPFEIDIKLRRATE